MATGPRLVNKQFNSPIGLYSQQNIQDTLSKQSQVLNNGAVGIDFNNPLSSKPANLANSAVLRMLEEEEQRQRSGQAASTKRVAWPPPAEENGQDADHEAPAQRQATPVKLYQSPALSRLIPIEPVSHGPPQSRVYSPQPQGSSPQPQAHSPQVQTFPPQFQPGQVYSPQPKFSAPQPKHSSPQPKVLSPQPKVFSPQPAGFGGQSPQPRTPTQTFPPPFPEPYSTFPRKTQSSFAPVSPRGYAPVSSQLYSPVAPSFPPFASAEQPGAFAPAPASRIIPIQFEEPPSTVTLRPIAPVHQRPAPIVASQPAANSFRGGVNMRGDQKWPPQSVKEAVEAENEARISLARGPACRPRKVKKDYTTFFAKNALPNNYPGYKVPPGTQHYDDITGTSQF